MIDAWRKRRFLAGVGIALLMLLLAACGPAEDFEEEEPTFEEEEMLEEEPMEEVEEPGQGAAAETILYIYNDSGVDLCTVAVSASTSTDWGPNLIEGDTLAPEAETTFEGFPPASYDMLAMDCEGSEVDVQTGHVLGMGESTWDVGTGVTPAEGSEASLEGFLEEQAADVELPEAGTIETDFSTEVHGFSFANFGGNSPQTDMRIEEARELFGDAVCASLEEDGSCTPTPVAQQWIDEMNATWANGRCFGFSHLSIAMFNGLVDPAFYDSSASTAFELPQEAELLQDLTKWAAFQETSAYQNVFLSVLNTPQDSLNKMMALDGKPAMVIFFHPTQGGHAVVGYGVRDMGDGIYHLLVYDNNWPGEEKYIEIDYNANTWTYALAALNPSEDSGPWSGDANSKTLDVIAFEDYATNPYDCPICYAEGREGGLASSLFQSGGSGMVTSNGGSARIVNNQGQTSGQVGGRVINGVPGGRVVRPAGPVLDGQGGLLPGPDPIYYLPRNSFHLSLVGDGTEEGSMSYLSTDFSASISGYELENGASETFDVNPDERSLSYMASGEQSPVIYTAFQQEEGVFYAFTLVGADLGEGQGFTLGVDDETGAFNFDAEGIEEQTLGLIVVRVDEEGADIFATDDLTLADAGLLALNYAEWDGEGPMGIDLDEDGDGEYEASGVLEDEDLSELADLFEDEEDALDAFGDFDDYLDDDELADLEEAGFDFDDEEFGDEDLDEDEGTDDGASDDEFADDGAADDSGADDFSGDDSSGDDFSGDDGSGDDGGDDGGGDGGGGGDE